MWGLIIYMFALAFMLAFWYGAGGDHRDDDY